MSGDKKKKRSRSRSRSRERKKQKADERLDRIEKQISNLTNTVLRLTGSSGPAGEGKNQVSGKY